LLDYVREEGGRESGREGGREGGRAQASRQCVCAHVFKKGKVGGQGGGKEDGNSSQWMGGLSSLLFSPERVRGRKKGLDGLLLLILSSGIDDD